MAARLQEDGVVGTYEGHHGHEHAFPGIDGDATWYTRLGWWIVVGGVGGFLLWASLAPLDKGVPLSGR